MDTNNTIKAIFSAGLNAVDPLVIVRGYSDMIRRIFFNNRFKHLLLTGFGKASFQMARALEESPVGNLISEGIVITKYGHAISEKAEDEKIGNSEAENLSTSQPLSLSTSQSIKSPIKVYEAGHPIPDENGLNATKKIIELLRTADKNTLVLCLVSGGGSALLVSPYNGITLNEKQHITELLLKAGADITELNTVRKHISGIKGGRLAEIAHPAKVVSLMISDVIGDKPDVIASGPTSPDLSTFDEALKIIDRFALNKKTPASIMDILNKGALGQITETPKSGNPVFNNVTNIIIGNNRLALEAAKEKAEALGFKAEIIFNTISGEAREAGKWLAGKAIKTKTSEAQRHKGTKCLISGGETTVTVAGKGKGGRNTELALSFAMEIDGKEGITLLSAGTDGTDGPTDAAGAVVDGKTISKAKSLGLNPDDYLKNNDSYNFFKKINSLLITGPTGTNVMDLQIIIVE